MRYKTKWGASLLFGEFNRYLVTLCSKCHRTLHAYQKDGVTTHDTIKTIKKTFNHLQNACNGILTMSQMRRIAIACRDHVQAKQVRDLINDPKARTEIAARVDATYKKKNNSSHTLIGRSAKNLAGGGVLVYKEVYE